MRGAEGLGHPQREDRSEGSVKSGSAPAPSVVCHFTGVGWKVPDILKVLGAPHVDQEQRPGAGQLEEGLGCGVHVTVERSRTVRNLPQNYPQSSLSLSLQPVTRLCHLY